MLRTVWYQTCARDGSLLQSLEALKVLQLALSLCARKPDNAYICRSLLCLAETLQLLVRNTEYCQYALSAGSVYDNFDEA